MNTGESNSANMSNTMTKIISEVEQYVDNQLENLTIQDEDFQAIRAQRLAELKKQSELTAIWKKQGHGVFTEVRSDKDLFVACKNSDDVVALFYSKADSISPILNHHLKKLCERHLEARFIKVDVDYIPFLKKKLSINDVPIILVLKNSCVTKRLVKLQAFGNNTDFETAELEWWLAYAGAIKTEDDLKQRPEKPMKPRRTNIRCSHLDSDDDLSDCSDSPMEENVSVAHSQVVDLDDGNLADLEDE